MKWMAENEDYCFCADEAVDASNSELLSLLLLQVTKVFSVEEYFLGYCKLDNIKSEHIVKYVKASDMV